VILMPDFVSDVHEMTPADERVYEAVLEENGRGHAPSAADLERLLPGLGRDRLDEALAHLAGATGFLEAVRVRDVTRYRPVEGARAPAAT
jgi:hypothetical protein